MSRNVCECRVYLSPLFKNIEFFFYKVPFESLRERWRRSLRVRWRRKSSGNDGGMEPLGNGLFNFSRE